MGNCAACLEKAPGASLEEERRGKLTVQPEKKTIPNSKEVKRQRDLLAMQEALKEQEREKEILEGQKKAMPMASAQPKAPLLFEQIQQIEEMEIITQKLKEQDNAKKKSFISAGMESEEEGIP